jgi:hypothetical protein
MLNNKIIYFNEKFDIYLNYFLSAEKNHLFNEEKYFKLHSHSEKDCYYQLIRRTDNRIFATLAFHEISSNVFVSPGRGTFGGISINSNIDFSTLQKFLILIIENLQKNGAIVIRYRLAPSIHDNSIFAITFNTLSTLGFQSNDPEINYSMNIDNRDFTDLISYGNIKCIRKINREGFMCEKSELKTLPSIHKLIADNRLRLGVVISMSVDQLQEVVKLFPEKLHLFSVYRDSSREEMLAAAICLSLTARVLYVLYWGEADGMRNYSPVVLLANEIHKFCQDSGIEILDVGISTLNGVPNHGLINFKRNLGFSESLKVEMVWASNSEKESI